MSFDYLMGYIMTISMLMQNFITIFHSVQEIWPFFYLFQNLALGKASTDEKSQFAIVSLFSESEPRQKLIQSHSFDNLMGYILSIFHSVSLFQNLAFGKASTDDKCHFAIP